MKRKIRKKWKERKRKKIKIKKRTKKKRKRFPIEGRRELVLDRVKFRNKSLLKETLIIDDLEQN